MNRHTGAGDASVKLLCATFKLSRAAYYAEGRRQHGGTAAPEGGKVITLPRQPRHTAAEVVLTRNPRGTRTRHGCGVERTQGGGRRCGAKGSGVASSRLDDDACERLGPRSRSRAR